MLDWFIVAEFGVRALIAVAVAGVSLGFAYSAGYVEGQRAARREQDTDVREDLRL